VFVEDTGALNGVKPAIAERLRTIQDQYASGKMTFAELAQNYSDDRANRDNGGRMEPFAPNRRPGNYVSAVIRLKPGEISQPVPTTIGWHILKLDSVEYVRSTEESKFMLKSALGRDARARKSKESLVAKLKKSYNFEESGKKATMKFLKKNLPDNYFQSTATDITTLPGINKLKPICTFADQSVPALDFAKFISRYQGAPLNEPIMDFVESLYPNFITETILRYERKHLADKYPEYKALVQEFHDGMMLYEINSEKVWNAAIKDTVGIERFYEKIKTEFPVTDSTGATTYKPLNEIRAIVVSRYQDYLEGEWIKELRTKYPVVVEEKVFQNILKNR
jgi:peptidyl-prolyl cis-trans isomerase SurA